MFKTRKLTKAIAVAAAFAQLVCTSPLVMAENNNEIVSAPTGVTTVLSWNDVKAVDAEGTFTCIETIQENNGTVVYNSENDCIDIVIPDATRDYASFTPKNISEDNGLVTVSYKLKPTKTISGMNYGKLAFNNIDKFFNNNSYGYRDNGCINWDYYGSSMTNGWDTNVHISDYADKWLDFEYKIDFAAHKIAAKISNNGTNVHNYERAFGPDDKVFQKMSFGTAGCYADKDATISVKDLTITRTQTVVASVSVADGAENVSVENPIKITFSTDVNADKLKEALTINGDEEYDLVVNGNVASIKIANPKSNKQYTLSLPKGSDVGGIGKLPENTTVVFTSGKLTGSSTVVAWEDVKAQDSNGKLTGISIVKEGNGAVSYNAAEDCIDVTANSGAKARFMLKNINLNDGLVTVSYKIKAKSDVQWVHFGKLGFDGLENFGDNNSYGYRDNGGLNWDFYNGSAMTSDWTTVKLKDYTDRWLDFEYKINFATNKIDAKITDNGNTLHSFSKQFKPDHKMFTTMNFGTADPKSADGRGIYVKDINITKTQTVVTGVNVADGAEIPSDMPIEIAFSTDVDADKLKKALTINDGNDYDLKVDGNVATVTLTYPEINKNYTVKLAKSADVGGFGTLPRNMEFTFKTIKPTGVTNVITWDKVKNEFSKSSSAIVEKVKYKEAAPGYNAAEDRIEMALVKGQRVAIKVHGFDIKDGLITVSYKLNVPAATHWSFGKLSFNGKDTFGNANSYGYRNNGDVNYDYYTGTKIDSNWVPGLKFDNKGWLDVEYKIDLSSHNIAAKVTQEDGTVLDKRNMALDPAETSFSGLCIGEPLTDCNNDSALIYVKDLKITKTNITVADSTLGVAEAIDPTADIKLTFNTELTTDDFKSEVIDNVIIIKDADGNVVNCTKKVAINDKVVTISIIGLESGKTYTLTIPEGTALGFGKLDKEYVGSFTTKAVAEISGTYTFANKTLTISGSANLPVEGGVGIIAVYNKADNSFIKMYTQELNKSAETQTISATIENVNASEIIVKGFVWNSLDTQTGMRPITEDAVFTVSD